MAIKLADLPVLRCLKSNMLIIILIFAKIYFLYFAYNFFYSDTCFDLKSALIELEKTHIPGKNDAHVQRLLMETKDIRRSWIEKSAVRVKDVTKKYPVLENIEMVIFRTTVRKHHLSGHRAERKLALSIAGSTKQ